MHCTTHHSLFQAKAVLKWRRDRPEEAVPLWEQLSAANSCIYDHLQALRALSEVTDSLFLLIRELNTVSNSLQADEVAYRAACLWMANNTSEAWFLPQSVLWHRSLSLCSSHMHTLTTPSSRPFKSW